MKVLSLHFRPLLERNTPLACFLFCEASSILMPSCLANADFVATSGAMLTQVPFGSILAQVPSWHKFQDVDGISLTIIAQCDAYQVHAIAYRQIGEHPTGVGQEEGRVQFHSHVIVGEAIFEESISSSEFNVVIVRRLGRHVCAGVSKPEGQSC